MFGANAVRFGEIGKQPVILLAGACYIFRDGNKRWSRLREPERALVVYIKQATFSRRYGWQAERLPAWVKAAAPALRLSNAPERAISLKTSDSHQGAAKTARDTSKGALIQLEPHRRRRERQQGTFHLGRHTYSAGPGYSWSCEYKIERLNPEGTLWEIYATDEETDEYQSMGKHGLAEAQEYFNGVQFYISQEDWLAMGATFTRDIEDDEAEEPPRAV